MTLTQKTDHAEEGVGLLIDHFKSKTNFANWLTAYLNQVQDIEDMLFQLLEDRWLDTATGVQLDGIGEIVRRERAGLDDDDYRAFLRAQILLNISSGTRSEILEILTRIISNCIALIDWYPAAFSIVISDTFVISPTVLASLVSRAAGVGADLEYTTVDDDLTFTFADGDTSQQDLDRGFAGDGADFVTNGDFSAWTANDPDNWGVQESLPNAEVSEVGTGQGHGGGGSGLCNLYSSDGTVVGIKKNPPDIPAVVGVKYRISFKIDTFTDNSSPLKMTDSAGTPSFSVQNYTSTGTYTFDFIAASTIIELTFANDSANSIDVTIDDVSLVVHDNVGGKFAGVIKIG